MTTILPDVRFHLYTSPNSIISTREHIVFATEAERESFITWLSRKNKAGAIQTNDIVKGQTFTVSVREAQQHCRIRGRSKAKR